MKHEAHIGLLPCSASAVIAEALSRYPELGKRNPGSCVCMRCLRILWVCICRNSLIAMITVLLRSARGHGP